MKIKKYRSDFMMIVLLGFILAIAKVLEMV